MTTGVKSLYYILPEDPNVRAANSLGLQAARAAVRAAVSLNNAGCDEPSDAVFPSGDDACGGWPQEPSNLMILSAS